MSKYKVKKLIQLLMPTLLIFNFIILIDYYFIPTQQKRVIIENKYMEHSSATYLVDLKGKSHRVDYNTYFNSNEHDRLIIEESFIFKYIKSIKIESSDLLIYYDLSDLNMTICFIVFFFIVWFIFKKVHENLYYLFFIPYMVMNLFFWGYLMHYKF